MNLFIFPSSVKNDLKNNVIRRGARTLAFGNRCLAKTCWVKHLTGFGQDYSDLNITYRARIQSSEVKTTLIINRLKQLQQ